MDTHIKEKEFNKKRAFWPFIKRIFRHSFRYKKWCIVLVSSAMFVAIIDGLMPLLWYRYIDDFITPSVDTFKDGNNPAMWPDAQKTFIGFSLLYLAIIIFQVIGMSIFTWCAGRIKEFVVFDLRKEMFEKLQQLPYAFYDRSAMGWLTIRLTADVDKVSEIISFSFVALVTGFMMICVSLVAMFIYNWQLGLVVLVAIPLMAVLSVRIRMLILKYARQTRRKYSHMAAFLTENINGIEVNKATVHEAEAGKDFRYISTDLQHVAYKAAYYTAMYNPVIVLMGSFVAAAVIYFGGHMALNPASGFTIGLLAAFFGYARMIFEPIMEVTRFYAAAQDSLSAGERIFSLIDEPLTIFDQPGAKPVGHLTGNVSFQQVSFSYIPGKPVIDNLNLDIKAGQSIAIVGPTGGGKSTIINLLCRFYEPTSGTILVDGMPYTSLKLKEYRKKLGIILQTAYLFSGTIRENIQYGKLKASDEEIKNALRLIGVPEFIERLDEQVGEEGSNLSSGEKQFIAFARVIIKDPAILIMDEATSSIDTLAEKKLQKGIDQIIRNRTAVIIAHRLSTIRNCDKILVFQKGGIVEAGSHDELMQQKGHYYALCKHQFSDSKATSTSTVM